MNGPRQRQPRVPELVLTPIGVVHSPFKDKHSAPRQPRAARGQQGTIELLPLPAYEHALADLDRFSHIWVIFGFDRNQGWSAKVLPPRSRKKRGVFATRAPRRPNPLGLSVVRLERIEGRVLHIRDLDMLDGTPVYDLKPYIAYADAIPDASAGWLEDDPLDASDPGPRYAVTWSERAHEQLAWLATRTPLELRALAERTLALGVAPHAYRRIRRDADGFSIGVKDFRLRFRLEGETILVTEIATGYAKRALDDRSAPANDVTPLAVHREFVRRFGPRAAK